MAPVIFRQEILSYVAKEVHLPAAVFFTTLLSSIFPYNEEYANVACGSSLSHAVSGKLESTEIRIAIKRFLRFIQLTQRQIYNALLKVPVGN